MTSADRLAGLYGARLAAYDETLQAGPRGLTLADLAPRHGHEAVAWAVRAGWLVEYSPGHYRAAAKEAVLAEVASSEERGASRQETEGRSQETGVRRQETEPRIRNPELQTLNTKPETPVAPCATLRAPSACPQQPKKGQLALFGM